MDLDKYKYKIELHTHTWPCSGCSSISPQKMAQIHKELGYDAVVITNHMQHGCFNMSKFASREEMLSKYMNDYYEARDEGDRIGITVLLGAEVNLSENRNDYLVYGVDEEFIVKASENLDKPLSEFYKVVKTDKNVIIQAHPFRPNMVRMPKEYIDGLEVFNLNPNHNGAVGIAAKYAAEEGYDLTICGSDFHNEPHQDVAAIKTKILPSDSFELAALLKSRDFLFDFSGNIVIPRGFAGKGCIL